MQQRNLERMRIIPPALSLLAGVILMMITDYIVFKHANAYGINFAAKAGISMITTALLFAVWLVRVPVADRGLPILFGKRSEGFILDEGVHWVPFKGMFVTIHFVSVKERTEQITKAEFFALGENGTGILMGMDITIQWQIDDLNRYLSVETDSVTRAMRVKAMSALRRIASSKEPSAIIKSQEEIADGIAESVRETCKRWGLKILEVYLTDIMPVNGVVVEAFERKLIEEMEKAAETVDAQTIRARIKALTDDGMPQIEAGKIVEAERGKMKREEKIMTFSVNDSATLVGLIDLIRSCVGKTETRGGENNARS